MRWRVLTLVNVVVRLGQHVDIVEDDTVELVHFVDFKETGVHHRALVETAIILLESQADKWREHDISIHVKFFQLLNRKYSILWNCNIKFTLAKQRLLVTKVPNSLFITGGT